MDRRWRIRQLNIFLITIEIGFSNVFRVLYTCIMKNQVILKIEPSFIDGGYLGKFKF